MPPLLLLLPDILTTVPWPAEVLEQVNLAALSAKPIIIRTELELAPPETEQLPEDVKLLDSRFRTILA